MIKAVAPRIKKVFAIRNYDLDATLTSGQAFRWRKAGPCWVGIIGPHWVRLRADEQSLTAETAIPIGDWSWLASYLQAEVDLDPILKSFPDDEPMRAAVRACAGLRLLRQDPWECLASFILSSTKQILQIQQIVATLCECFGDSVPVPMGEKPAWSFPGPERLAKCSEAELRACKMGFRAPYLLGTARAVAEGSCRLYQLHSVPVQTARECLMALPGVGRKIADCVLLFAYGFQEAFPVDVWVLRALNQLYFPRRRVSLQRLHRFAAEHFGPNAGYAQQYLFHYMRKHHAKTP